MFQIRANVNNINHKDMLQLTSRGGERERQRKRDKDREREKNY